MFTKQRCRVGGSGQGTCRRTIVSCSVVWTNGIPENRMRKKRKRAKRSEAEKGICTDEEKRSWKKVVEATSSVIRGVLHTGDARCSLTKSGARTQRLAELSQVRAGQAVRAWLRRWGAEVYSLRPMSCTSLCVLGAGSFYVFTTILSSLKPHCSTTTTTTTGRPRCCYSLRLTQIEDFPKTSPSFKIYT